jgi:hypothetical protein
VSSKFNELQSSDAISKRLFICNLHPSVSEGNWINIFQAYGKIAKVNLVWHKSGHPKGFAFLEYTNVESATKAVGESSRIKPVGGRQIVVRYCDATDASDTISKDIRKRSRDESLITSGFNGTDSKVNRNIRKIDDHREKQMRRLQETLLKMEG